jgi:nitrogen fixation/metabolism regulation signal transduction histidine kinase
MLRLTVIIYGIAATVLMGVAITAVLATPSLADDFKRWIPIAAAVGAALAIPVSYIVARAINSQKK